MFMIFEMAGKEEEVEGLEKQMRVLEEAGKVAEKKVNERMVKLGGGSVPLKVLRVKSLENEIELLKASQSRESADVACGSSTKFIWVTASAVSF